MAGLSPVAQANLDAITPYITSASQQYNVPVGVIAQSLYEINPNFDQYQVTNTGAGIANLPIDPLTSTNQYDPATSINAFTANLANSFQKLTSSGASASDAWTSILNNSAESGVLAQNSIAGIGAPYFGGATPSPTPSPSPAPAPTTDLPLWRWGTTEWKAFLTNSAFGLTIGVVGMILILGSVWILIEKSGIEMPPIIPA